MPPSNITPATAIDIVTFPFSVTVDPEGTGALWYKHTPIIDTCISLLACNSTDDVEWEIYVGDSSTLKQFGVGGQPQIWPIKIGQIIYFKINLDTYTTGKTFLFSLIVAPTSQIQVGDLIISEDYGHGSAGDNIYDSTIRGKYPYTWYSDSGIVRYVTAKLPAAELGCCLTNGKWGIIDHDNLQIFIYDILPTITEIGRFPLPIGPVGGVFPAIDSMATDFNFFYVIAAEPHNTPHKIFKVTDAGVITGPIATLPIFSTMGAAGSGGNSMSGVSRDGSILYYPNHVVGGLIQRHNLLTNTPLSSFSTPNVATIPADTLVLSDGTIVAIFYNSAVNKLVHYSIVGVILNTYDFGTNPWAIHHIVHEANDNSDFVWVWTQDVYSNLLNKFQLLQLSTGSITKEFTRPVFFAGRGTEDFTGSCTSMERFGAPDSCPLMIVMKTSVSTIPDLSGIYFINPTKSRDTYYTDDKKIPNPTVKTALLGE